MKTYRVAGPWPHMAVRSGEEVEIPPGETFTEDEIPPGCLIELNVQAGLVKEVEAPKADAKPAASKGGSSA